MHPNVISRATPQRHTQLAENIRRRQLLWIAAMVERMGLSRTEIARKAGVSPSTLSKFENDADNIAQLEAMTVTKLEAATGIFLATFDRPLAGGLAELEAAGYEAGAASDPVTRAVAAMVAGENSLVPWRLETRAIELSGYLPGDVIIVDLNAHPHDGDVVCAQVYDRSGTAVTVFRIYQKPFLTSASNVRPPLRPLIVDDNHVQLRGVVVASFRPRLSAGAREAS